MGIVDRVLDRTYDVQVRGQPIGTYQQDKPVETITYGKLTHVRKFLTASGYVDVQCPRQHNFLIKSITARIIAANASAQERECEITHYFSLDEELSGQFRQFYKIQRIWNTAAGGAIWVYCNPLLPMANLTMPAATLDLEEFQWLPLNIEYLDQGERLRVYLTFRDAADIGQAEIQYYDVQLR